MLAYKSILSFGRNKPFGGQAKWANLVKRGGIITPIVEERKYSCKIGNRRKTRHNLKACGEGRGGTNKKLETAIRGECTQQCHTSMRPMNFTIIPPSRSMLCLKKKR